MLAANAFSGRTLRQAACDWVTSNTVKWGTWLSGLTSPECPMYNSLQCGGSARGTCAAVESPYPLGACTCATGFGGSACELETASCAKGYARTADGASCQACAAGKFESGGSCSPISSLSYGSSSGADYRYSVADTSLLDCPTNTRVSAVTVEGLQFRVNAETSAMDISSCVCEPGYYIPSGLPGVACIVCPDGATCLGGTFPPYAARGYAQLSVSSTASTTSNSSRRQLSTTNATNYTAVANAVFFECRNRFHCDAADSDKCDCLGGSIISTSTYANHSGIVSWNDLNSAMVVTTYSCDTAYVTGSALCSVCEGDNAMQLGECNSCSMADAFYIFVGIVFVVIWFPSLRVLITRLAPSMYTTTSFIQYVGLYGSLNIPWGVENKNLFDALNSFNLELEAVHFTCADIGDTFEKMWIFQVILLPLLYPVVACAGLLGNMMYRMMCEKKMGMTPKLMQMGFMPQNDFSKIALAKRYGMPGLFYWNLYFYTGVTKSLEMLVCEDDGSGKQFVVTNPQMTCWEGDHSTYSVIASFSLFFYLVGMPLTFGYLILRWVPKHGYFSPLTGDICGFLFRRFQPELHMWELVEMNRRIIFATVMGLSGVITTFFQSCLTLLSVFVTTCLELSFHPFRCGLYGTLEAFTSLLEVGIIFFGLVLIAYPEDQDKVDMSNGLALASMIIGLLACVFCLVLDLTYHNNRFVKSLRTSRGVMLPESVFDTRTASLFWVNMLKQADKTAIANFKEVEELLLKQLLLGELRSSATTDRYKELLKVEPYLFELLCSSDFKGTQTWDGLSNFMKNMQSVSVNREHGYLPLGYLFTDAAVGPILRWLTTFATDEERTTLMTMIAHVHTFQAKRETSLTMGDKIMHFLISLTLLKDQQTRQTEAMQLQFRAIEEKKESFRDMSDDDASKKAETSASPPMLRHHRGNRISLSVAALFPETGRGPETNKYRPSEAVGSEAVGSLDDSRRQGLSDVQDPYDRVVRRLVDYVSCASVSLIPSPTGSTMPRLHFVSGAWVGRDGKLRVKSSLLSIKGADASFNDPDVAKCVSSKKTTGYAEMFSSLCVPVIGKGDTVLAVIKCEGKYVRGRLGLPFTPTDARLVELAAMVHDSTDKSAYPAATSIGAGIKASQVAPAPQDPQVEPLPSPPSSEHPPSMVVDISEKPVSMSDA